MKTSTAKLEAKLAAMSREDLIAFAGAVVWSLYASTYDLHDELTPEELEATGLAGFDSGVYLDSEKEWDGDTVENVGADVDNAGLNPKDL